MNDPDPFAACAWNVTEITMPIIGDQTETFDRTIPPDTAVPQIEVPDIEPVMAGQKQRALSEWTRAWLAIALLAMFAGTIAYGCWETTRIMAHENISLSDRREEIGMVKDWLGIALAPITALLGTAVAFFYIEHK